MSDTFVKVPTELMGALPQVGLKGLAVYCALRMHSNNGSTVWPSGQRLATIIGCCRSTVLGGIEGLEKAGFLIREKSDGSANTYTLTLPDLSKIPTGLKYKPVGNIDRPVGNIDRGSLKYRQGPVGNIDTNKNQEQEPKIRTKNKNQKTTSKYLPAFEEFWTSYPRRVGKAAAYRQWKKIPVSNREHVLRASEAYAKSRKGEDPKFTPHPSKWLSDGRYDDDKADWKKTGKSDNPGSVYDPQHTITFD